MKTNPKTFVFTIIGIGAIWWASAGPAGAVVISERTFRLNDDTVRKGYTVTDTQGNFRLGIAGGVFSAAQVVRVAQIDSAALPADQKAIAGPYQVIVPDMPPNATVKPLTLRLAYEPAGSRKVELAFYNADTKSWSVIPAKFANGYASATTTRINGIFTVWTAAAPASQPTTKPPAVKSVAAYVVNNLTGQVLYQKNADQPRPMASLTKLMTALVFLEHNPGFNKVVALDKTDASIGAKLYAGAGETLTVKDLFYTMLVGSANNCANALARSTGLTRAQFVAAMNKKAREFGLTRTTFSDPSGLDTGNVTTAQEYMQLTDQALQQAEIRKATTTKAYTFKTVNTRRSHTIKNTNLLTNSPLALVSGKTGYLDEAGYCLMTRARNRQGTEVTAVVMGAASRTQAPKEVESLIKWGFSS